MIEYTLPDIDWRMQYVSPIPLKVEYDELTLGFDS